MIRYHALKLAFLSMTAPFTPLAGLQCHRQGAGVKP
jgi:hypothetical protein